MVLKNGGLHASHMPGRGVMQCCGKHFQRAFTSLDKYILLVYPKSNYSYIEIQIMYLKLGQSLDLIALQQ